MISVDLIRNFCIIAHIDHGKSTLADRFLELTKTVSPRKIRSQYLDQMPLERERGVTIKLTPVTMKYKLPITDYQSPNKLQIQNSDDQKDSENGNLKFEISNSEFVLNLIDTPGHVDFYYEVSRSLAAVEGAILLIDASQGIQAQTITNLRIALEHNLAIIPVLNKIDLPGLDLGQRKRELASLLNVPEGEILLVSAKTGQGVEAVLEAIIKKIPPPRKSSFPVLRALVFDSFYSEHRGVIVYLRVFDGQVKRGDRLKMVKSGAVFEVLEVGVFKPELTPKESLVAGEIGYLVTGLREIRKCRVGDTVTCQIHKNLDSRVLANKLVRINEIKPLPGYQEPKPMVFSTFYSQKSEEAEKLGQALERLQLNDPSLVFKPEHSFFGLGYNCGFLGLFHLEIIKERLKREYNLEIIVTRPMVGYRVWEKNKNTFKEIHSPTEFLSANIEKVEEPVAKVEIITPPKYLGDILVLIKNYYGQFLNQHYLATDSMFEIYSSLIVRAEIPLGMLIIDFYDKLKNVSAGFASLSYEFIGYREADLVRLDVLIAGEKKEEFASIVYRGKAYQEGKKIVEFLKNNLPRQLFEVKIQAALGSKIIAAEKLPALRKDVTAKLYGGDVTRKKKLLAKQKRGKKKLLKLGRVEIPSSFYFKMLKR